MSESHRYTILAAGADETAIVLASTCSYLDVGDTIDQAEMPPLPGVGAFVWLDLGTTLDRSGEFYDEATPSWRGTWLMATGDLLATISQSLPSIVLANYVPTPIERERNAVAAQRAHLDERLDCLTWDVQGHAGSLVYCWRIVATCIESGGETLDPDDQAMDPATLRRCADLLEKAIAAITGSGKSPNGDNS